MYYMTYHVIRYCLSDDLLAQATFWPDGVIALEYRAGLIHPALVRRMSAISKEVAHSGAFRLDYGQRESPPELSAWLEPGELGDDLMRMRFGLPPFFEVQVRADMIDPALLREVNDTVLPAVCAVLLPGLPVT